MARQTTTHQHLQIIKPRAVIVLGVVASLNLLLGCRLTYLQTVRHAYFQKEADSHRVSKTILPARRGLLLDRSGEPLAINVPACWVYADPLEVQDPAATAAALAPLLGEDPARLQLLLIPRTRRSHYVSLKRGLDVSVGQAVKAARLLGVGVVPDARRAYPNGDLAAQVLGFTNRDGVGIEGLESSQNDLLTGRDGAIVGEIDKEGRWLPGTTRQRQEPENGLDLVLTIDKRLQHAADEELARAVKAHGAKSGVVVILDVKTGEIRVLSNAPGYDPNAPRPPKKLTKAEAEQVIGRWRNRAVSDLYEPGSTLKTITSAACLQEEGLGILGRHVFCGGAMQIGGKTIHCANDPPYFGHHGDETLRGVLKESCNIGMAQFGMRLGADKLFAYEQEFGFTDFPGSGLPGEAKSKLQSPAEFSKDRQSTGWAKIRTANVAFGQGISVTPLHLAAAYACIANDGVLMRPHIVRAVRRNGTETPRAPEAVRRVLDPEVARTVRSLLGTVVQEGTGKPAQIAGFTVGGKTGSAQVFDKGYNNGKYVASFVGMVPLSKPRLVILCAVFEPKGVHWGAAVAAPVVHNLARQAMLQMQILPDAPQQADWEDRGRGKQKNARVRVID